MSSSILSRPGDRPLRHALGAVLLLALIASAGCFRLVERETFAIGGEANRMNLVVHTRASKVLYDFGRAQGSSAARSAVIAEAPAKIPISNLQRATICTLSVALCLSADQIGRTLVSWFKADIRHRSDFWEAVSAAGRNGRCFAWTFAPARNLTHKGLGTSGCGRGA